MIKIPNFLKYNVLSEKRESKYNGTVEVWRSWGLGTYITVDGLTQSGGILNAIWKSTLRKIRNSKFEIRNILVLGLGGGTAAKWVKYFWPNAKITGVEIDPAMVELGAKYLGFDKGGIKTVIGDAYRFLAQNSKHSTFDLVIVDLYVGNKIPVKFESSDFITLVGMILARGGVVVFNRVYYKERKKEALEFGENLRKYFSKVDYFYPTANLMIICK